MELKLGLDIGITSVGWGIIDENYDVKSCGVRLFAERSASNNADIRRPMRSSRRRTRRLQHRLHRMGVLLANVLNIDLPEPQGNIYEIRCRGLREKLSAEEFFLAIMHLTKRRGTHYLTVDDIKDDEASSSGEKSTEEILAEQQAFLKDHYVCEWQYRKYQQYEKSRSVQDKVRGIENRFTNQDYLRELKELLRVQGMYYPAIVENYNEIIEIYSSKREYYDGPGSEKSPTPYGCYRYNENGEVEYVNLIDEMRGKCSYLTDEPRIAAGAYTACLFNLLNDLNNLTVQGNPNEDAVIDGKLSENTKRYLVEKFVNNGRNVKLDNIAKYLGVKESDIKGYRIDKKEKPIFTEFKQYFAIRRAYDKLGREAEIHGNRELCDVISDILTKEKAIDRRQDGLIRAGLDEEIATSLARGKDFTQYHSLSKKAIEMILDDLWVTSENQMALFIRMGLKQQKEANLRGAMIPFDGEDWVVSPVMKRAINEAVKVINAARKWIRRHYGIDEFSDIIIEMARDNNGDEQKKRIKDMQKKNEQTRKEVLDRAQGYPLSRGQFEIIRYLNEQNWESAYSENRVSLGQVLNGELEVEHIIPRSISLDNSQSNKVAAFVWENQQKGQRTPAQYLRSQYGEEAYQEFKKRTLTWCKNRKKRDNLFYEDAPERELHGFINRNLVDTRYACREVLNLLQEYYKANNLPTKVKVVRGSFTHYFRSKAKFSKDRDTTFAHHAQDALIVAGLANMELVQQMNRWAKVQSQHIVLEDGRIVNRETGEIIAEEDFDNQAYLRFVSNVEKVTPQYSHKVDRKPNRQLYDANIKATRTIAVEKDTEEETYIVTKYKNIYDVGVGNSGEKLKKKIKEKPKMLLMYHHDPATYRIFKNVVDAYPDVKNPFAEYFKEHGPIRKYSRKGNGPEIYDVKFLDGRLGSHRKNTKQSGQNRSVYLSIKSLRIDIYQDGEQYKFVSVPYDMVKRIEDPKTQTVTYHIDETAYREATINKKIGATSKFLFSLYRGELFSYEKEGVRYDWQFWCLNNDKTNTIETKWIHKPSPGNTQPKRMITIGSKIKNLRKYHVDVLGNRYPAPQEELKMKIEL